MSNQKACVTPIGGANGQRLRPREVAQLSDVRVVVPLPTSNLLESAGGGGDEVTPDNFREDDVLAGFTQLGGYYTK